MNSKSAISKINTHGALLVFPIKNEKEPRSLWSEFYPRSEMKWEWTEDGDDRVMKLWMLMKKLSDSRDVVYSKWYQGRATFFSRRLFTALLQQSLTHFESPQLSPVEKNLLEALENDSPISTKELKKLTELQGRDNARYYNRGMKELFKKFLIVAFGEVEDGAFPSLAVGATRLLYEELLISAQEMSVSEAQQTIEEFWPVDNLFRKYYEKVNF